MLRGDYKMAKRKPVNPIHEIEDFVATFVFGKHPVDVKKARNWHKKKSKRRI